MQTLKLLWGAIRSVIIRKLVESDVAISYRWRNDKEVFKYTGANYQNYIEEQCERNWLARVVKNANEYRCAIEVDGVYVGNIYLTDIDGVSAEYQIFIGEKSYWGQGVAIEASQQILRYAFEILKFKRVFLNVKLQNDRAVRLYNMLGFNEISRKKEWITMEKYNYNRI